MAIDLDPAMISTLGAGGAGGIGIWLVLKALFAKVETIKTELEEFRVKVAEKYVSVDSMRDFKMDMDKRFDRIETLLNGGRAHD